MKYRELVRSGAFGGPIFFRYADVREVQPKLAMHSKSMNGGPIVDMASHWFDVVRFFTGEEPTKAYARGHVFGSGKKRLASVSDPAFDAASFEVTFGVGHTLDAFINWGMAEGFGSFGAEMIVGPGLLARMGGGNSMELMRGAEREVISIGADPQGPAVRIDGLIRAMRGEAPLEVTGEDGRISLSCSLAVLKSIESGEIVEDWGVRMRGSVFEAGAMEAGQGGRV